ncbi:3-hydroxyisobutyryl-CoA hydrolase, mitochondrial-like [Macrosteles quadrilineatus]|uniref:3-hydroxyisobutyryl-CoA hydrolase, mitochondrial-like n=1 Tax=Macrosteles quadrilineatus TaxID=74068 RepID=UPI0023E1DE84|nr:3-hydroxyisobutyryl-CoA hydrolase, mitochondrial-like [Macrosteles quadrilineatus]
MMVRWGTSSLLNTVNFLTRSSLSKPLRFSRNMSTQPGNDEVVLSEIINNKGVLTLNRPRALNSLNEAMVTIILEKLKDWEHKVDCVVVRGAGEKAFCAGGDVVAVTSGSLTNCNHGKNFFRKEYTMDYIISQYKKPYIALIDGITMGGGVGISVNGKYRIATEKTLFAMPETAIGLFPDVGASYFLSRLEGKLGLYLALTGQRLKGKDVVKIGFGTHYIESKNIPTLYEAILKGDGDVESTIKKHSVDVSDHTFSLAQNMGLINEAFSGSTVEEIFTRLEKDGSQFSQDTLKLLNKMSPISMKISKVELEKGAKMSLKECLQMEFRLAKSALEATSSPDFYEGVRALLKDKDQNPKWNPSSLQEVTDDMVNKVFLPISPEEELKLSSNRESRL